MKDYNFNGKNILVVDDNKSSLFLAEEILKRTGANVISATDGEQAILLMPKQSLDLVLMDMLMPVMDGYITTKTMHSLNPDLPIIAYTACAMQEDKAKCLSAGCNDYLAKPVSPSQMLDTIEKYLK